MAESGDVDAAGTEARKGGSVCVSLSPVRLEADKTRGELDGARTAQARYAGGKERLSCGKDRDAAFPK